MSEHEPETPEGAALGADSASAEVPSAIRAEPATEVPAPELLPSVASATSPVQDCVVSTPWERGPAQPLADDLPSAALSVTTLAVVGFSLALAAQTLHLHDAHRSEFLISNVLGEAPRKVLLASLIASAGFALASCGLVFLFKRERMLASLNAAATLLGPLSLSFALPLFFIWQFGQQKTTYYLILLTAFVFASRALLTRAFRTYETLERPVWLRWPEAPNRLRLPTAWGITTVALAATCYAAYTGHYTVLRHRLVQTTAFDLGIYDNLMFNVIHGRLFKSPVLFGPGNFSYIAGHAEYVMVLFAPIYALKPGSETLLWLQAVILGGAAIPLYLFARNFISRAPAVVLSLAYLMFAPLHGPNFYDFHWLPVAIFFQFWLFYAIATRRTWLVVAMVLVLFATREDIAIGLTMLGVFLFMTGARVRLGLTLAGASVIWFGINKFIIMPRAGAWWFETIYSELFADGKSSYGSVLVTLLSNPIYALTTFIRENKLAYGFHMLAPLAFLPLRKVAFVLLLIPGCFFTLLTTAYWPTLSIAFQYTSHWIPFLFLSLVLSLWLFKFEVDGKAKFYAGMVTLVIAVLSHSYNFGGILQRESFTGGFSRVQFSMSEAEQKRWQALQAITGEIPRNASVAASEYMNPHISARLDAYVFRYDVGPVDYILISKNEVTSDLRRTLNDMFHKHKYGLVDYTGDEFYLFKRDFESTGTAAARERLGLTPQKR